MDVSAVYVCGICKSVGVICVCYIHLLRQCMTKCVIMNTAQWRTILHSIKIKDNDNALK